MEHKLKSVLSGTGFYLLLGVCLIAAAVSGWFLLFSGDKPDEEQAAPTETVSAPVESAYIPEPEPDPVPETEEDSAPETETDTELEPEAEAAPAPEAAEETEALEEANETEEE